MPIRFRCPSCQQAIEVDNADAGQSIQCCYCRAVITAPTESQPLTTDNHQVKTAQPASGISIQHISDVADNAPQPPSTPPTTPQPPTPVEKSKFTLGLAGLLCSLVAVVCIFILAGWLVKEVLPMIPANFNTLSPAKQQAMMQEKIMGLAQNPLIGFMSLGIIVLAMAGFALSLAGIITKKGKNPAIAGLVISIGFLCCQCAGLAISAAGSMAGVLFR